MLGWSVCFQIGTGFPTAQRCTCQAMTAAECASRDLTLIKRQLFAVPDAWEGNTSLVDLSLHTSRAQRLTSPLWGKTVGYKLCLYLILWFSVFCTEEWK